jgi:hypothetical protein
LTPVFNIRGADNIFPFMENPALIPGYESYNQAHPEAPFNNEFNDLQFSYFPVYDKDKDGTIIRNYINYNEEDYRIYKGETNPNSGITYGLLNNYIENVKGVVRFRPTKDTNTIYGIDIRIDHEALNELKKYVKGYFFVRQTRIPTILAQGITMGID